jgi:hypothetical protein
MPPSIAIATPVLGDSETMRVVLNSSSSQLIIAGCVGHASVHCDSDPCAGGSERACALAPRRVVCFTAAAAVI